jgi:sensory rhodopsin
MFGSLFPSSDIVTTSYGVLLIATMTLAVITFAGLSWVSDRWRLAVALAGGALLASAIAYLGASETWQANHQMTAASRYIGWFVVQPIQVATVYFFAGVKERAPAGVFWRTTVAAILMVFGRYLGDAGIFNATLGVLISIAFWLYILGEMYFGAMNERAYAASAAVGIGYFWIRLIMTIGWVIYPILHFVDVVIGAGHAAPVIVLYTIADLVNLIVVSMIVLAVAGQESY